jgi:hypothetical protein
MLPDADLHASLMNIDLKLWFPALRMVDAPRRLVLGRLEGHEEIAKIHPTKATPTKGPQAETSGENPVSAAGKARLRT